MEGRGDGFRVAMSALEGDKPPEGPTLAYAIEARQPMFLVNEKGMLLETNTAFSRMVGFPRHQIRGFQLQDLFQGRDAPAWDDLQEKLLRDFQGGVQATLVRKDSSFQNVRLEAVAFDRNMALVWIADPQPRAPWPCAATWTPPCRPRSWAGARRCAWRRTPWAPSSRPSSRSSRRPGTPAPAMPPSGSCWRRSG